MVEGPAQWAPRKEFEAAIGARVTRPAPAGIALFVYAGTTARMAESFLTSVTTKHAIDRSQFMVLFSLWCVDPPHRLSPTTLHRALVLSPSGLSHTMRRLEEAALVRRVADAGDGRAKYVELTPKGIRRLNRCVADLTDALDEIYDGVEESALDDLAASQLDIALLLARSPRSYPVTARPAATQNGDTP